MWDSRVEIKQDEPKIKIYTIGFSKDDGYFEHIRISVQCSVAATSASKAAKFIEDLEREKNPVITEMTIYRGRYSSKLNMNDLTTRIV